MTLYLCGCQDDREPGGWKFCRDHELRYGPKPTDPKEKADEPDSPTS